MTAAENGSFLLAVAGSRSIRRAESVFTLLDQIAAEVACSGRQLELRVGDADGVDVAALMWARSNLVPRHVCFASRQRWREWRATQIYGDKANGGGVSVWDNQVGNSGGNSSFIDSAGWQTATDQESGELSADWDRDGRTLAGSKRNAAVLYGHPLEIRPTRRADLLLAIHDGVSPGTATCIAQAELMDIPVRYELVVEG